MLIIYIRNLIGQLVKTFLLKNHRLKTIKKKGYFLRKRQFIIIKGNIIIFIENI